MSAQQLEILIVDDNVANLRILGATFEDDGFTVHAASSVEEAQIRLKEKADKIALVLSDIQMPGLSGFDLVKWMKAECLAIRTIPILLITSQLPDSENRILGLSLGAVDYLLRSLDMQEIVLRVRHAIENYDQIKSLRHTLESAETLASAGRLFAASNHEIKNIAQIIKIASGIIDKEIVPGASGISDNCLHAVQMLSKSAGLLVDVTKMISGIVGDAPHTVGPVDLQVLAEQVVSMMKPMFKGNVELVFSETDSERVVGSATFIKQILINFLLNARDSVEEKKPTPRGRVEVKIVSKGMDSIALAVCDNGVGLPVEETRTEFKAFASSKQLRGGTGLGLWLSSHLAQKMNGKLELYSAGVGQGAEARIILKKVLS